MKLKLFTAACALLAIAGCTQEPQNTNEQSDIPWINSQFAENPTGLEGNWINKKYADELRKTGSPKASQQAVSMSMLVFPRELKNIAIIIWNFHEGTNSMIKQQNSNSFEFQPQRGGSFQAIRIDNGILKTGDNEFIRLQEIPAKRDYYVGEQLLFAGKYDFNGKPIEFTKDGRIIGLDAFTFYSVELDYAGSALDVDQVRLGTSVENSKPYGFAFSNNILTIYELKCIQSEGKECMKVSNGKELYKLVKSEA